MSHACTPILMGVASLFSEILLLSKTTKFPFRGMDYSPWSSKNLIDRNRFKKFMQVGIDVTCYSKYVALSNSAFFGITHTHSCAPPHNIYSKEKKNKILKWFEDVFIATSGEDQLLQQKEFEKALKTNGVSENINSTYIYM